MGMRANKRGELFIVSAPSGAGKTTICNMVCRNVPGLKFSVSYTTRKKRRGEKNNVHYTFVSESEFKKMIKKGEFAEWAVVHGNHYGTSIKRLEDMLNKGYDVILDIDTQGARQMKRYYRDAVYIFIMPPSIKALKERLSSRSSETAKEIARRLERAREELVSFKDYDYIIINKDLKTAVREMESIILARRLRIQRVSSYIKIIKNYGG
jgi:guanylate kinase